MRSNTMLLLLADSPVKERMEPQACTRCGRPTWSATGECIRCRKEGTTAPGAPVRRPPIHAPTREVQLDAFERIAEDVPCRACGYNLRGLAMSAVCPECSTPIERSVRPDLLRFADPAWVERLSKGMRLVIAGIIAGIVFGMIGGLTIAFSVSAGGMGAMSSAIAVAIVISSAIGILVVVGVWFLTTPDPGRLQEEPTLSARRLCRWCAMVQLLQGPLNFATMSTFRFAAFVIGAGWILAVLGGFLLGIVVLIGYVAGLTYLMQLAPRIPTPSLAPQTKIVRWGIGISNGLNLAGGLGFALAIPSMMAARAAAPPPGLFIASSINCVSTLGVLVFGVWALVLLFRYAAAFRREADAAREMWIAGEHVAGAGSGPEPPPIQTS